MNKSELLKLAAARITLKKFAFGEIIPGTDGLSATSDLSGMGAGGYAATADPTASTGLKSFGGFNIMHLLAPILAGMWGNTFGNALKGPQDRSQQYLDQVRQRHYRDANQGAWETT